MKLLRRNFLHLAASAAALPAVSRFAWAQAYPSHRVLRGRVPALVQTKHLLPLCHFAPPMWC